MNILTDAEKPHVFAIRELELMLAENEKTLKELRSDVLRLEKEANKKNKESQTSAESQQSTP